MDLDVCTKMVQNSSNQSTKSVDKKIKEITTTQKAKSDLTTTQNPRAKKNKQTKDKNLEETKPNTIQKVGAKKSDVTTTQNPRAKKNKQQIKDKNLEETKPNTTQKLGADENKEKENKENTNQKLKTLIIPIIKALLFWLWVDTAMTWGNDVWSDLQPASPGLLRTLDPTLCHLEQNRGGSYSRGRMRNAWSKGQRLSLCVHVSWENSLDQGETLAWEWSEQDNKWNTSSCDNPETMENSSRFGNNLTNRFYSDRPPSHPKLNTPCRHHHHHTQSPISSKDLNVVLTQNHISLVLSGVCVCATVRTIATWRQTNLTYNPQPENIR